MSIKVLVLVGLMIACYAAGSLGQQSRVSDDQLDSVLNDPRYLTRQIKCALGEAPCDPVGRRLKKLAPLVLQGSCPQCSSEEAQQIKKVLSHIQLKYPKEWSKVVMKYSTG